MFTLIAIGTGVAYALQPGRDARSRPVPGRLPRPDGSVAVYFEAAAVITVLVLLGQVLELRARERTGGAIRALLDLAPKTARRLARRRRRRGGAARPSCRPATGCACGPGDRVPVDGAVLEGGERRRRVDGHRRAAAGREGAGRPGDRRHGERHAAAFVMRAEQGRRARRCWRASCRWWPRRSARRAPIQRLADRVAGWFVPAVLAVAVLAFVAWAAVGSGARASPTALIARGLGADHRLPLRARAGDADVDHGRRRPRRRPGRADQERRGAGAAARRSTRSWSTRPAR